MVQIKVKGLNNAYHVVIDYDDFNDLPASLKERLLRCSNNGEHAFKAFFHLPEMNDQQLRTVFRICNETNTLILGINEIKSTPNIRIVEMNLHNGQCYEFHEPIILLGSIEKQAYVTVTYSLYVIGNVYGTIDLLHEECQLYVSKIDAMVRICDTTCQKVTSFSPVNIYYENRHLGKRTYEEERMWARQ